MIDVADERIERPIVGQSRASTGGKRRDSSEPAQHHAAGQSRGVP
jgi:hypothetical protein